jgi:cytochrome c oxidase assembly protein subunit 15
MRGHDLFRYAAIAGCLLCYTTILLGGNVMASDSGLACPDWPSCFGNGNYLPAFQGGVALEWGHRVAAFFLSVSILVLGLLGVVYERTRPVLMRLALGSLALVVTEALLGGLVVVNTLAVSLVLLHLALATALFGVLLILVLLSNLRELPRRWLEWARRAADAAPEPEGERAPFSTNDPAVARGAPGGRPREG